MLLFLALISVDVVDQPLSFVLDYVPFQFGLKLFLFICLSVWNVDVQAVDLFLCFVMCSCRFAGQLLDLDSFGD